MKALLAAAMAGMLMLVVVPSATGATQTQAIPLEPCDNVDAPVSMTIPAP